MTEVNPEGYNEIPDHRFITGQAVQYATDSELDGGFDTAIAISQWLATLGVVSYVSPAIKGSVATVLIPDAYTNGFRERSILFPTDWVIVDVSGKAFIYSRGTFAELFLKHGDPLPSYLSY